MTPLPHLAQRLLNAPLMIRPEKAEIVMAALAARLGVGRIESGLDAAPPPELMQRGHVVREGYDVAEGVALIQVQGTLVQRLGTLRPYSGMTGYDGIRQNFLSALMDPAVRAIVLDIDSPGGEVAGCFDLADQIYAARGIKPIWAVLAEGAYSAAYALASAADRITVPRTGGAGSIGVITMLADLSRALGKDGIAVHFVTYGERKAEEARARFTGVSPDLLARIQGEIDQVGELFVATVARNRRLSADRIRAQQAACFLGAAALDQQLVDAVMPPDQAFRALLDTLA